LFLSTNHEKPGVPNLRDSIIVAEVGIEQSETTPTRHSPAQPSPQPHAPPKTLSSFRKAGGSAVVFAVAFALTVPAHSAVAVLN